ncbi:proton extrusion protein PcxA [Merismopedia glauca]|uniref:Proton extrusion protein PxcA n=1 Tax=Merismopedia glauca CCAP 1448/3 TaxID=1296344 RepID=A0A2T1C5K2_9CYAN|nr:proton extrusion protein PcxA [Merismopedia glauca]PSB03403.1 proton extrusion protein PcxA [Merismopedia glauca CCAP 1448/3]
MEISGLIPFKSSWRKASQWLYQTPERSLDQAYSAALKIKALEDEHFGGKKVSIEGSEYGDSLNAYFLAELRKYLNIAKVRLVEFRTSRSLITNNDALKGELQPPNLNLEDKQTEEVIIEKLKFIDSAIARYTSKSTQLVPVSQNLTNKLEKTTNSSQSSSNKPDKLNTPDNFKNRDVETVSDKTKIVPRTILGTLRRIKRELDPEAEEKVVTNFRKSKNKTVISLRFLLLLILIPLLVHQISKATIVGPLVDKFRVEQNAEVFLNVDLQEEAFREWERYEKEIKFKTMLGIIPQLNPEEMEEKVKERVEEIKTEYAQKSADAVKNVFADMFSLLGFALVIVTNKKEIAIFKSFIDEIVYGLSDSAKAFIIILLTDIFVGYHSPHGWEVVLTSISRHLGLPENEEFNFLFIATFPVILDTIFKYWIFRYLNRISPSAVATYRNMNE